MTYTGEVTLTFQIVKQTKPKIGDIPMSGYILIDTKQLDISDSSEQTISGIFDSTTNAYNTGKFIKLTNCVNGTESTSPIPATITSISSSYISVSFLDKTATITSSDGVTIS